MPAVAQCSCSGTVQACKEAQSCLLATLLRFVRLATNLSPAILRPACTPSYHLLLQCQCVKSFTAPLLLQPLAGNYFLYIIAGVTVLILLCYALGYIPGPNELAADPAGAGAI